MVLGEAYGLWLHIYQSLFKIPFSVKLSIIMSRTSIFNHKKEKIIDNMIDVCDGLVPINFDGHGGHL